MTREEAIQSLKDLAEINVRYGCDDKWIMALNMAIEALQREEAEAKGYCHRIKPKEYFKDDAINRADAMGAVQDHFNADGFKGYDDGQKMMDRIKALPSAEQVISKLNNPCDSLLTDGSNGSKEHKSKLDLISRQDVIEALCRSSVYAWSIEQDQTAHNWALNIIKALPSADAEEYDDYEHATLVDIKEPLKVAVVRCKDCKYSFYDKDYESYNCRKHEYVECFDANDYCSWGERND